MASEGFGGREKLLRQKDLLCWAGFSQNRNVLRGSRNSVHKMTAPKAVASRCLLKPIQRSVVDAVGNPTSNPFLPVGFLPWGQFTASPLLFDPRVVEKTRRKSTLESAGAVRSEPMKGSAFMPRETNAAKKPYSSPSLIVLDASAAKAKLKARGDQKDPIIQKMLSSAAKAPNRRAS